jgi:redox-sensitive bicupin YhaK (pirin superfamily)
VIDGEGAFGAGDSTVASGHMALFENDGDQISMTAIGGSSLNVLLIAGMPLHEPVVRYGPFVMNTREEIAQAIEDYQKGRMGNIARR